MKKSKMEEIDESILKCNRKRKVKNCCYCCRYKYCTGQENHPYINKDIDIFLWGR